MVWRTSKEEFDSKCILSTVKRGGVSVTVVHEKELDNSDRVIDRFYLGTISVTFKKIIQI